MTANGVRAGGVASRIRRPGALPPMVVDLVLASALAALVTLASLTSIEEGATHSAAAAWLTGGLLGGVSLLRRRWPVAVLLVSMAVVLGYHMSGLPAIGIGWPLALALYTCAARGRLRAALGVVAFMTVGSMTFRLTAEPEPFLQVLSTTAQELAVIGLILAFGDAVRSRRGWAAELKARMARAARERELEAGRRVVEERLRIARELHDVMAHTLAVATVQLNVAADTIGDDPAAARAAIGTAQQVTRQATAELATAVRVLRQGKGTDDLGRAPAPGVDDIERLLGAARDSGLRVEYQVTGEPRPLPAPVGLAVHRIVQESLTNVLRHANATTVSVRLAWDPDGVGVRVADDGDGSPGEPGLDGVPVGHGLIGMRERALGLGGEFDAGPGAAGGFAVTAWLPTPSTDPPSVPAAAEEGAR